MAPRAQGAPAPVAREALVDILDPQGTGHMLPAEAYCSDAVFAWELEHFFARGWVCVGRSEQLAQPGERRAVRVGDDSVLLVRNHDGALRAFFNVCRHRGHEMMACGSTAKRGALHCPYHAWTYDLDGALQATPRYKEPDGFVAAEFGLVPARVQEWCGFVMVNLSGDAADVDHFLGDLGPILAPWDIGRLRVGATHDYVLHANWKLAPENYHECYHCPAIHPELCVVTRFDSGDNHNLAGLWVGGSMTLSGGAETMSLSGRSGAAPLPGLTPSELGSVLYVGTFPNMLISAHPDYVMTHRLEPRSATETHIECQWLFDPRVLERDDFDPAYAVDFWDITNRQDWDACEGVQRGLRSRGYRTGPFGRQEDAVQRWVQIIARSYLAGAIVRP